MNLERVQNDADGVTAFFSDGSAVHGDLLVLLGTMCWVAYTMAMENFRGWSALRFTTLTMIPGTLAIFAVLPLAAHAWRAFGATDCVRIGELCQLSAALKTAREARADNGVVIVLGARRRTDRGTGGTASAQ